jgi:hypothetical protein
MMLSAFRDPAPFIAMVGQSLDPCPAGSAQTDRRSLLRPCDAVSGRSLPSGTQETSLAKNQNTYEKRRREIEKRQRSAEKLERRRQKKERRESPDTPEQASPDATE